MARLVWWSGASIAPRVDTSEPTLRAQPAIDGAIAVVADEQTLHVVNLALQREIAQVDVSTGTGGRSWVLANRRLVLVESTADDGHCLAACVRVAMTVARCACPDGCGPLRPDDFPRSP